MYGDWFSELLDRLPDPVPDWETTMPIPAGPCPACAEEDRHIWAEADRYVATLVTLRRMVCACDRCLRWCGAQAVFVDTPHNWSGRHYGRPT